MGEAWGVLAAVLSSALGGTSIGATRYLVNAIDPLAIGSFRFGIGFVLLLPVALLQGARWPARRDWPAVAALGMLFFAAFPLLFNASLIFTTAARGALALSTLPLLTMLVGAVLGSEALTARKSLGVVIATLGVAIALLSGLTGRMRTYTAELTKDVWRLEQRVTAGHLGDPESFLDEMFRARHGLLAVSTMSALSREVYARMVTIAAFGPGPGQALLEDAVDQFHHLSVMADSQKAYLQGTIEFYQARTNTKMTIAAERLAVIAAVTLPITALSSVLGMNLIVNDETLWRPLAVTLAVMLAISATLLVWAKRKGWF